MQCVCFCFSLHRCQFLLRIWSSADPHTIAGAPSQQALWYSHLAGVEGAGGSQLYWLRWFSKQALCTLQQNTVLQDLFVGGSTVDPLRLPRGNRLKQYI